jgi:hypothetical protein
MPTREHNRHIPILEKLPGGDTARERPFASRMLYFGTSNNLTRVSECWLIHYMQGIDIRPKPLHVVVRKCHFKNGEVLASLYHGHLLIVNSHNQRIGQKRLPGA